jgi:hypothetical protein
MTGILPGTGRRMRARVAALAWATLACDQSFYFDAPGVDVAADAEAPPVPTRCRTQADCPFSSLHCDPLTGGCFECVQDRDCTETATRCSTDLHRCVECNGSHDCPMGLACDATTRRCLTSCVEEYDCPASAPECDERRGVCVACDEDAECRVPAGGGYCALDGSRCVECRSDLHCAESRLCDGLLGQCVVCRDSEDCEAGLVCDPASRICVSPPQGPR